MNILVNELHQIFKEKSWTLAVAESCTGGLFSATLAKKSGISDIFLGGVVSYANSAKTALLGIPEDLIKTKGAVSEFVAINMAQAIRRSLSSSWSVSMTGIAGPTGGTPEKPVGTIWFGYCGPDIEGAEQAYLGGNREQIQLQAVEYALGLLIREAKKMSSL